MLYDIDHVTNTRPTRYIRALYLREHKTIIQKEREKLSTGGNSTFVYEFIEPTIIRGIMSGVYNGMQRYLMNK